jgi:hypothetical protein
MIVSGRSQERQRLWHFRLKTRNAASQPHASRFAVRPSRPTLFQMSKYTAFRCPEDLLELAKVKAKKDRRSLSNYIITLIEKDVQDMLQESEEPNELHAQKRK